MGLLFCYYYIYWAFYTYFNLIKYENTKLTITINNYNKHKYNNKSHIYYKINTPLNTDAYSMTH